MTVKVKICGLKDEVALAAALDGGADYVGFVFYPRSPRSLSPQAAARLAQLARGPAKVVALLDDPETPRRELVNKHLGNVPLDQAIDRFYTSDVFMHTWDLARATGQDDRLDADFCAALLGGMEPMDDLLRASGQYGPRVPTPDDADAQTRLLGFIGRDPFWKQV